MSNTDFVLSVEDLTVSFDGFKAIDSLNLYVDQNELRVIIGPNGAGKTTLLDLICGKTRASAGSIKFKNSEMTKLPEYQIVRSGIGRKFQTPSIYENLSVFQNLEVSFPRGRGVFGALFFKRTEEVKTQVQTVADEIGTQQEADQVNAEQGYLVSQLLNTDSEVFQQHREAMNGEVTDPATAANTKYVREGIETKTSVETILNAGFSER